jgi:hypothetical protein
MVYDPPVIGRIDNKPILTASPLSGLQENFPAPRSKPPLKQQATIGPLNRLIHYPNLQHLIAHQRLNLRLRHYQNRNRLTHRIKHLQAVPTLRPRMVIDNRGHITPTELMQREIFPQSDS